MFSYLSITKFEKHKRYFVSSNLYHFYPKLTTFQQASFHRKRHYNYYKILTNTKNHHCITAIVVSDFSQSTAQIAGFGTFRTSIARIVPKNNNSQIFWNWQNIFFPIVPKKKQFAGFVELSKLFFSHSSKNKMMRLFLGLKSDLLLSRFQP